MTRFFPGIFFLALCSSCSVYQTSLLKSDIKGTDKQPFTIENDSVQVRYSFPRGVANIEILNKSKVPLYVDWGRSALITDGKPSFFWSGDVDGDDQILFIPPDSRITKTPFHLPIPETVADRKPIHEKYTLETSPLNFRSYLLMSFDQSFYNPITLDNVFWLAEKHQTREPAPGSFRQDTYYAEIMTDDGSAAAGVLGVIVAVPIVLLYSYLEN